MSNRSDPTDIREALERAQDAFEMAGRGRAEFEVGISADDDWKTQLTKACRLVEGLFTREAAEDMKDLYSENRTESYYGGGRPTKEQADAMADLAAAVHRFSVNQIREGGVCLCN